jgi:signal transduction histidine kinase
VGLAFAAFGVLVELGLDQVVAVAPWLIVAFIAGLLAAILGDLVGGLVAAVIGVLGQVAAVPAWVPGVRDLDGAAWPFEVATAVAALVIGLGIRRAILVRGSESRPPPGGTWVDGTDVEPGLPWRSGATPSRGPGPERRSAVPIPAPAPASTDRPAASRPAPAAAPSPAALVVVANAIRDFGAVRTPIQIADALARHAAALSGAPAATVYIGGDGEDLAAVGRHGLDPAAPARLASASLLRRNGGDSTFVPILAHEHGRPRLLGAIRLAMAGNPAPSGVPTPMAADPLLDAVVQLAADALERARLDAARRSAEGDAAGAVRRLSILGGLALELVGGTTVEHVADTLLAFAIDDLGAGFASVHVADEASGAFTLAGSRGIPAGVIASQSTIAADATSPVVRAAQDHAPVEVVGEEGWQTAFPRTSNVLSITGARAISAIPMEAGGAVHGVLTIGWRTQGDRTAADRGLLAAGAAQGAQALERAILHAHDEDARTFQEAFIGVVSHELRTPITTILAGSRLLRRRLYGDPRASELTEDIEVEADRLARIVDDLLVLSRLERRHLTVGDDPVHLDHLLARVIRSESARWPDHRFVLPTSPSRHVVLGEETYVEQILRNLISNAAKYSPIGSTIEITIEDAPDGEVLVRVLDQGPGVAPGEVEDLFSLFYRSPSTAASAAGAGIGLFVSRRLVAEMGGRVWAQPRPEGGSEFGFSLGSYPIDEADDEELPLGIPGSATAAVAPAPSDEPS